MRDNCISCKFIQLEPDEVICSKFNEPIQRAFYHICTFYCRRESDQEDDDGKEKV